jgi:hypothetical protein
MLILTTLNITALLVYRMLWQSQVDTPAPIPDSNIKKTNLKLSLQLQSVTFVHKLTQNFQLWLLI